MSFPAFQTEGLVLQHQSVGAVNAEMRPAIADDVARWERDWAPVYRGAGRAEGDWPWAKHIERALASPNQFLCIAISRGDVVDALMSLAYESGLSRLDVGQDRVYVEYVGVAPEHRMPPLGLRAIKGLARLLVGLVAPRLSVATQAAGRVALHSKDDADALRLYRGLNMEELGPEQVEDGTWIYFEGGPAWAQERLR